MLRLSRMQRPNAADLNVAVIFCGAILAVLASLQIFTALIGAEQLQSKDNWILNLALNLFGYCTVFVPGFLVINHVRKSNYLEHGAGFLAAVRLCVYGSEETIDDAIARDEAAAAESGRKSGSDQQAKKGLKVVVCFFGLQIAYLTWGVLQVN